MLYSLSQEDLRSLCKSRIETFEIWARRIIHEKLSSDLGPDYLEVEIRNNEKILNKDHYASYQRIKASHPDRCQRPVDALFIETLIYILCKESLYRTYFKEVLDYAYPQGRDEAAEFLKRIIKPRNSLSHSNPITIRLAEQTMCYTGDFIDSVKNYYTRIGADRMWNTPTFVKVTDSLGNEYYPTESKTISETISLNDHIFYVGDKYKICVEVDSTFDESEYCVIWKDHNGNVFTEFENKKEFEITFSETHISAYAHFMCTLIHNKTWHKHNNYEHELHFCFQILPCKKS